MEYEFNVFTLGLASAEILLYILCCWIDLCLRPASHLVCSMVQV